MDAIRHRIAGHPATTNTPSKAPVIDTAGLPLILNAEAIHAAIGGALSLKTIRRRMRSQELPSFLFCGRRVTRREDLVATIAKLAKSA